MSPLTPRTRLEALLALITSATHDAIAEYERTGTGELPSTDTVHPCDSRAASLKLRSAVRVLEGACDQLCTIIAPPKHTLFNRSYSHLDSTCLQVAIEGNIAGILADHPEGLPLADIAKQAGMRSDKLGQVMRFLATKSCFTEERKAVFKNNRLSSNLVGNTHISDMFLLASRDFRFNGAYAWLTDPRNGLSESPEKPPLLMGREGTKYFDWLKQQPGGETFFGSAMVGANEAFGDSDILAENYPFDKLPEGTTFCDVGGGIGAMCVGIAKAFPRMHITLQDQPSLEEQAREFLGAQCPEVILAKRLDFVPIDFLKEPPVKSQDIYYLRYIIHNWDDQNAIVILKNVCAAMKPDSRLLIHEHVLGSSNPETAREASLAPAALPANYGVGSITSYYLDLTMMNILASKERSPEEFRALGVAAGLEFVKLWDLVHKGIVEFKVAS